MAEEGPIDIKLFLTGAEEKEIVFSNIAVVQHEEQEFRVDLCTVLPSARTWVAGRSTGAGKTMPYLPVKVVARIGMTAPRMVALIDALQTNFQAWQSDQPLEPWPGARLESIE